MLNKKNNNLKKRKTRFEGIDLNTLGQNFNFNNQSNKRAQSEIFEEIDKSKNMNHQINTNKKNIIN